MRKKVESRQYPSGWRDWMDGPEWDKTQRHSPLGGMTRRPWTES